MFAALSNTKVKFINAKLDSIEKVGEGYQLQLDNDQSLSCALLIGADGARSRVRDLTQIEFSETNYQQKAMRGKRHADKGLEETTWQRG